MLINSEVIVPMTEANQNFSKVARLVDEKGSAVIMKNNRPRYMVLDFESYRRRKLFLDTADSIISENSEALKALADEDIMQISRQIMEKNREAYEVLAQ